MRPVKYLLSLGVLISFVNIIFATNFFSNAINVNTLSVEKTEVFFSMPDFEIVTTQFNQQSFAQFEIKEGLFTAETGLPELPFYTARIAVPINSKLTIENISLKKVKTVENLIINPVQNLQNPDYYFDYNTDFYHSQDKKIVYPELNYSVSELKTVRDMQIVTVNIYPVRFFPAQRKIEIVEEVRLTVNHYSEDSAPTYYLKPKLSPTFERIYENLIDNYTQIRTVNPVYQEPSLIIIFGGDPDLAIINNLRIWKEQRGLEVTVVGTSATGSSASSIKNYIQNAYDTWENPPEFVMIIGDVTGSYAVPTFSMSYGYGDFGAGDYPYTHLSGPNTLLGDVVIGRLSVANNNQLNAMINKVLTYEKNPLIAGEEWYHNNLLVGDSRPSGISTYIVNRYIRSEIYNYDQEHEFVELYTAGVNATTMQNVMSQGVLNSHYRGFVGVSGFNSTHVSQLTNINKLMNCVWLTCLTGTFASESIIEDITRYTSSTGALAGAITAIGMSTGSTHTAFNNALTGAIYHGLYTADLKTVGEALLYAKLYLVSAYNSVGVDVAKGHAQWANLMGAPSLNIFKTKPKSFGIQLPATIATGTQGMRLDILDSEANPVKEAWITLSKMDGSYISKTFTDEYGVAYLSIDSDLNGTLAMVVSKEGFAPMIGAVTTNSGAMIAVENYLLNDITGNNNQQINPGETISLTLSIKNYTNFSGNNLMVTLSSENEYINITESVANIASIGAGATQTLTDVFVFEVSQTTPDRTFLPLTVEISDGTNLWTSYILLMVKGINVDVLNTVVSSGNDYIELDENSNLYFEFVNNGIMPANNITAKLVAKSVHLIVTDSLAYIGNIQPGEIRDNSSEMFSVHPLPGIVPGMALEADIILFNSSGYEEKIPVSLIAGYKLNSDPTGPCDYGYIFLDSNDESYSEGVNYDWIEIKHVGQNTGIADVNGSQEEDSAVITLPFMARFYGENYNEITVCSNGWLAFGQTEQKDFRNLPLPGPIAPKAMLAPYWTDLVVGGSLGGGVYTYYHQEENAFIIQWEKARLVTGYSQGAFGSITIGDSVAFQVIIYDPQHHVIAYGDSPIKIQYRRFLPGISGSNIHPFNHVTVGIQDHTSQRGLTFVYDNQYTPGSSALQSNRAILITQPDMFFEEIHILLSDTALHDENANNIIEAGENVNIGINLTNAGMLTANNLTATLSFDSEYINVLNAFSDFPSIPTMQTKSNLNYYQILVSPETPDNYQASSRLIIECGNQEWERFFSFTVKKPTIAYFSYFVNDFFANNNGILESQENAKLIFNLHNSSMLDINGAVVTISSSYPGFIINQAEYLIPKINANSYFQSVFDVFVDDNNSEAFTVPLTLTVMSQNAFNYSVEVDVNVNQNRIIFYEDFDHWIPAGWIIQYFPNAWSLSQTNYAGGQAPEVKFTGFSNSALTRLISRGIDVSEAQVLSLNFKHSADISYAGSLVGVAFRVANSPWHTLWTQQLSQSFTEESVQIQIDTEGITQNMLQLCWFIEGEFDGIQGYYLDNINLQLDSGNTTVVSGKLFLNDFTTDFCDLSVKAGSYSTKIFPDSTFTLYLMPDTYSRLEVVNPFIVSNVYSDVSIQSGLILNDFDFDLYYKSTPNNLNYALDSDNNLSLSWSVYYHDILSLNHFNIYRQINSMHFVKIGETTDCEYTEIISSGNIYRYFVTAEYASGQSDNSEIVTVDSDSVSDSYDIVQPLIFDLKQNYPNPFNPVTNISFTIPEASNVKLRIYNIKGQLVKDLKNEFMEKGTHILQWNGDNNYGNPVSSGIYFIKLQDSQQQAVKKALLLK